MSVTDEKEDLNRDPGPGVSVEAATALTGPLPPAQELAAYEAIHAGATQWILEQAALNARHVREMEAGALRMQAREALLHRILPVVVILCFLAACTAIALVGHVWWGLGGIIATLGAVLTVY